MERIKLDKNLYLDEYIPEELYKKYDKKPSRLIWMLDNRLVTLDQFMRDRFGSVTINSWATGGNRNWSGLRTPDSSYYSFTSQHAWGRASDKIFSKVSAEEIRKDIIKNYDKMYKPLGLTCIEANVSWLHSDLRNYDKGLLIVKP